MKYDNENLSARVTHSVRHLRDMAQLARFKFDTQLWT